MFRFFKILTTELKRFAITGVDYGKLNAVTRKDVYPIPLIEDILSYIGSAKYFSSLDMFSGYWQCRIKETDKHKTAFVTSDGLYVFNRLSFGLCNAPATFQKLADTVFHDLKWKDILIYLDDIVTCAVWAYYPHRIRD